MAYTKEIKEYPQEDGSINKIIVEGDENYATMKMINYIPKEKND